MSTNVEQAVIVRFDPHQAPPIAYHREHGVLVVTFGPDEPDTDHLAMVLRREVAPDVAQLEADQRAGDERRWR